MVVLSEDVPAQGIPEFFAGRAVFITGATGFMGKVLVERLLWTCPDVGRLYLLVRDKAGAKPEDRLLGLKRSQVFDALRTRRPAQLDKLRIVCGDITRSGLGISAQALEELQEVSVVFNCAATVRFDEPLRVAAEINVLSVERLMKVCDELPRIAAFIHVSTGFSNTERASVGERVYDLPNALPSMLASALAVPDDATPDEIHRIISPKPNTYTYTKMMGETVVVEHRSKYPVAIFRPTIVTASLKHPYPGWTESLNGPGAFIISLCKGLLHVFRVKGSCRADLIPVDIAIDTLIAVAWETAIDNLNTVRVYNCSSSDNPTTWGELRDVTVQVGREHPLADVVSYPYCFFVEYRFLFETARFFIQTLPFHVIEYLSRLFNHQKSMMNLIKLHQRLCSMSDVYLFFTMNEWTFDTSNVRKLRARMSSEDAATFNLDTASIDWKKYYNLFARGCCLYLAKAKEEDLPQSRKRLHKMYLVHRTVTTLLPLLLVYQVLNPELLLGFVHRATHVASVLFTHLFGVLRSWFCV